MSGNKAEYVCAACDWVGIPTSVPTECPNCGLAAAEVLSPTGASSDDPPDNDEFDEDR